MTVLDRLLSAFETEATRFGQTPKPESISGAERVWMLVYEPAQERRLRARMSHFGSAATQAGCQWKHFDIRDSFALWLAENRYRDQLVASPQDLAAAVPEFRRSITQDVLRELAECDESTILAIMGAGSLFGVIRTSDLIEGVAGSIPGRMLVLFPGTHSDGKLRLFDARDGWNYLATVIKAGGDS